MIKVELRDLKGNIVKIALVPRALPPLIEWSDTTTDGWRYFMLDIWSVDEAVLNGQPPIYKEVHRYILPRT